MPPKRIASGATPAITVSGAAAATTKNTVSATPSVPRWRRVLATDPVVCGGCWGAVGTRGSVMEGLRVGRVVEEMSGFPDTPAGRDSVRAQGWRPHTTTYGYRLPARV